MPTPTLPIDPFLLSIILTLFGGGLGIIYCLIGIKTLREKKFQKPAKTYEYGQAEQIEETGSKALLRGSIFLLVGIAMLGSLALLHTVMLASIWVVAILLFGAAAPVIW